MKMLENRIEFFKGIEKLHINPQGADLVVYGGNESGKTTLYDANAWLLFGRDSRNQHDFLIKTLSPEGKPQHHLRHSVEVTLQLKDGRRVTLKKVLREKWTKGRNKANTIFDGHITEYYIDGVKVQAKEYNAFINDIMEEDLFKLITNPSYFNEKLHWEQRRNVLLEITGEPTLQQVVQQNHKLAPLLTILANTTNEEHRKKVMAQLKEINEQAKEIDVRIDEDLRRLKATPGHDAQALEEEKQALLLGETQVKEQLESLKTGESTQMRSHIRQLEEKAAQMRWEEEKEVRDKLTALKEDEVNTLLAMRQVEGEASQTARNLMQQEAQASRLQDQMAACHVSITALSRETCPVLASEGAIHCPTCGQPLPPQTREVRLAKAREDFETNKANKLMELQFEQKQNDTTLTKLQEVMAEGQAKQLHYAHCQRQHQDKLAGLQSQIQHLQRAVAEPPKNPDYQALQQEIAQLKGHHDTLNTAWQQQTEQLQQQLHQNRKAQRENQLKSLENQSREKDQARITQLEDQLSHLNRERIRLEEELYLTEEYMREKVRMMEDTINSKFQMARFKLFHQQQNGALVECCETTHKGVPYHSLNTAARINLGLDIIQTLSRHYGVTAPVFVDNAESVVNLLPINSQVISLVVSAHHPQLTIEARDKDGTLHSTTTHHIR